MKQFNTLLLSQWEFFPWEIWVAFPKERDGPGSKVVQVRGWSSSVQRLVIVCLSRGWSSVQRLVIVCLSRGWSSSVCPEAGHRLSVQRLVICSEAGHRLSVQRLVICLFSGWSSYVQRLVIICLSRGLSSSVCPEACHCLFVQRLVIVCPAG